MAACAFCYATVADGAEVCPRCGRAVGARAPVADGPSLTPWTERTDGPPRSTPAADSAPSSSTAPPPSEAPAPTTPAAVEPRAEPVRPPGAPWRAPDAAGHVAPPPSAAPPAAVPWTAPPGAPATGWPAGPPTESRPPYAAVAPVAEGAGEDLDRSNAIVLVVVSAIVALGLVIIAVLASNGVGPSLDELEGSAGPRSAPSAAATPIHDLERIGGR